MISFLPSRILVLFFIFNFAWFQPLFAQLFPKIEDQHDRHILDDGKILSSNIKERIFPICKEIEDTLRIRIMIKTEIFADLSQYPQKVDLFFSEWIRSIGLEKRGILLFAGLPNNSNHGKINLRVGIGLKYLITREMGEKILNEVLVKNDSSNDGQAFLDGVLTIKRMLMDEFKQEKKFQVNSGKSFDFFDFLWNSKEVVLAFFVGLFLCYIVFFIERCPRCNGALAISFERIKDAGLNTLGLRCKVYRCDGCGFLRRKKEPIFPSGIGGIWMRMFGPRRNIKIDSLRNDGDGKVNPQDGQNSLK
ncbi:TPM domain-containing protein [bacterium]|nr:TPM domain-containing protein [bacterium]